MHERLVHLLQISDVIVIKPSFLMILDFYSQFSSNNIRPYWVFVFELQYKTQNTLLGRCGTVTCCHLNDTKNDVNFALV